MTEIKILVNKLLKILIVCRNIISFYSVESHGITIVFIFANQSSI